ncbi:TetR-like C-terminal domain-containing protein [Fructilactobacillus sp. Tb1]|uniref:TetR-like C-terminal domain-containing protein n=1 Tax=Fructilactobacillus sp. Tb1 TaxID=3422304 RepID=UPI003D29F064
MTDRRILKTKKAIKQSFLELLKTQPDFDHITVKMICDQADIGRKTFYAHYQDKFDLMDEFLDQYLAELEVHCANVDPNQIKKNAEIWVHFFMQHRHFFQILWRSSDTYQFRNKLNQFTRQQFLPKITSKNPYLLDFIAFGVDGIIEQVVLSNHAIDEAKIVTNMTEILLINLKH